MHTRTKIPMKKFLFLVFFVAYSIITNAQDVIITKDSERIEAQISEILDRGEKASTSVSFYMGLTGTGVSINF